MRLIAFVLSLCVLAQTEHEFNPGCNSGKECPQSAGFIAVSRSYERSLTIFSTINEISIFQLNFTEPVEVSDVKITYSETTTPTISLNKTPSFVTAQILTDAIIFDDSSKKDIINNSTVQAHVDVSSIHWDNVTVNGTQITSNSSFITLDLKANTEDGVDVHPPHLTVQDRTTSIWFHVDLNATGLLGSCSKLAFEWTVVSSGSMEISSERTHTINDEYSPSVFGVTQIKLVDPKDSKDQAFFLWKPISYMPSETKTNNTGQTNAGDVMPSSLTKIKSTIVQSLFSSSGLSTNVKKFNLTMGSVGDGLCSYKVVEFSALTGFGAYVPDSISYQLIITIATTLAIPAVAILYGIIRICCQQICCKKKKYQEI